MTTGANSGRRRRRTRPYPQRTLEDCLEVVATVYSHGTGGVMDRVVLAGRLGTTPTSSAFVIRLASCARYGLTGPGSGMVELTARGEAAAAPSSPGRAAGGPAGSRTGAGAVPALLRGIRRAEAPRRRHGDEHAQARPGRGRGPDCRVPGRDEGERALCRTAGRGRREPVRQRQRGPRRPAPGDSRSATGSRGSHRASFGARAARGQGHTDRPLRGRRRCPDHRVDPGVLRRRVPDAGARRGRDFRREHRGSDRGMPRGDRPSRRAGARRRSTTRPSAGPGRTRSASSEGRRRCSGAGCCF